jgi:NADP-dependent 3-hydroxy acid dehydrogenase YdfG
MHNRVAIVTGASSGIGRSVAYGLAQKKIRMVLNGRDRERLSAVAAQVNEAAGTDIAQIVCGDITDKNTTSACILKCINTWQLPPSIYIAAAGRGLPGNLITSDDKEWDNLIETNIKGLMHQLRSIANSMLEQVQAEKDFVNNPSDIIVIGSTIGRNVSPFNSVYGATKFATHGLTEALRRQLGPHGIRVTLIEPGLVKTGFQRTAGYNEDWFREYSKEVGPVLIPEDVAQVINFLIDLPGNVHLDNISIRPTRQAYP